MRFRRKRGGKEFGKEGKKKGSSIYAKIYIYPQAFFSSPTAPVDGLEGAVFLSFGCL